MYWCRNQQQNSQTESSSPEKTSQPKIPKNTITVEDTLEILYVRFGRENLDYEISSIFG
jgi:hypothetical protein